MVVKQFIKHSINHVKAINSHHWVCLVSAQIRATSLTLYRCSQGSAGNALALEFASKGYRVFATARSLKSLGNLQEKGIEILTLDVTDPESISALKTELISRTGGSLDILFNNAGARKSHLFTPLTS